VDNDVHINPTKVMFKSFSFSYSLDEVEEISNNENISVEESEEIVIKLMKSDEIYVGERVEGVVEFDSNDYPIVYKVDYRYCSEVGEDWNDDVWEELEVEVQL
jgi:hypothetical protein